MLGGLVQNDSTGLEEEEGMLLEEEEERMLGLEEEEERVPSWQVQGHLTGLEEEEEEEEESYSMIL
jgi:hypothetical protein